MSEKKWYEKLPHPYVLLFLIIVMVTIMTYIIPAGEFAREEINGRMQVIPGTFEYIEQTPVGLFDMFRAIPKGMSEAAPVIFIVFLAGAFFKVVESTGALESGISIVVRKFKKSSHSGIKMIWIMTFVYGILGAVVGFENNIAIIPVGVIMALAMGYDLMVGAGMTIAAVGIGFATSPINPYTVGVSQSIAELPVFSGFVVRGLFCAATIAAAAHHTSKYAKKIDEDPENSLVKDISTEGLSLTRDLEDYELTRTHKLVIGVLLAALGTIVYGTLNLGWYIIEISTVFLIAGIVSGIVAGYDSDKIVKKLGEGASDLATGGLIIGVAQGISVVLKQGHIADTILVSIATPLEQLPSMASGMLMALVHGVVNFFIPSGSGQAMATMPIMIPLSDLVGITRQTAVLAFQIGDGIMNLIIPTLGGLLAMLALARIPFDRWFRFVFPLVIKIVLIGWGFTAYAVMTNWGPF